METQFTCSQCRETKLVQESGGTGYALDKQNLKVCYACCGLNDAQTMRESDKITLYLTGNPETVDGFNGLNGKSRSRCEVTNWPGSLRLNAYVQTGRHNIAGKRYDAWFTGPDGAQWHGVTYGDNTQICHCRKLKAHKKAA